MEKNFVSQSLEYFGYISAFGVAMSQYFFRDTFKDFFTGQDEIYSACSLFVLILSIVVIVAIFTNRVKLTSKHYFFKKSEALWREYISASVRGTAQGKPILEPCFWTVAGVGFWLIPLAFISFLFFLLSPNIYAKSGFYVATMIMVVSSVAIFTTILYVENLSQQNEKNKQEELLLKIRNYFAGEFSIASIKKVSNYPVTQELRVVKEGKFYKVSVNADNPDQCFLIEKEQEGV